MSYNEPRYEKNTLIVHIGPKVTKVIKDKRYNLCISKMVNNEYNVVWKSESNIRSKNVIDWIPSYSIFCAHSYKVGEYAKSCTAHQGVKGGEHCTLNNQGILERASGTPHEKYPLYICNEYAPTHIGVSMTGENGKHIPIYVSPEKCGKGISGFEPQEKVIVWFEKKFTSGHMITDDICDYIEVDFTCERNVSVVFTDKGKWEQSSYE